jgi:hypothetical protein
MIRLGNRQSAGVLSMVFLYKNYLKATRPKFVNILNGLARMVWHFNSAIQLISSALLPA